MSESNSGSAQPSESLFDTNFTENSPTGSALPTSSLPPVLPTSGNETAAIINYRILVSVKEAGIIIGKNGSVIASIRDNTGVKAGVSKVIPGCADRVLTVTGPCDAVSHALNLISAALITSPIDDSSFQHFPLKRLLPYAQDGSQSLRLLIPNAQMGTIIGKQGNRIKALQQNYDVRIVASKDFLHNSTERLVELQGTPQSIEDATKVLSRCLIEDWHNGTGTTFYSPSPRAYSPQNQNRGTYMPGSRVNHHSNSNSGGNFNPGSNSEGYGHMTGSGSVASPGGSRMNNLYPTNGSNNGSEITTRTVNYPSDMVGCLIGKGGSRVQEIRKVSGAQINIATEDDSEGKRAFTLSGPIRSVEKAISFLTQNLEREQERRERMNNSVME